MSDARSPSPAQSATPNTRIIKPRVGTSRKSKAERDQFAREEQAREKVRTKESTASPATSVSRGAKAARSRGAATLERTRSDATSGVFGSGAGEKQKRKAGVDTGFEELLEGNDVAEPETQNTSKTTKTKPGRKAVVIEDVSAEGTADASIPTKVVEDDITDDDEPDEPRRDIDRIWMSSDEEEEAIIDQKGKQKASLRQPRISGGLRPVRAPRTKTGIEEEVEEVQSPKKSKTVRRSGADPIDVDEMEIDDTEASKGIASAETRKKTPRRPAGKSKDARAATETVEERAERLRVSDDIQKLRQVFPTPRTTKADTDLVAGKDESRLLLFQFPPLTPALIDSSAPDDDVVEIKQENLTSTTVPTSTSKGDGKTVRIDAQAVSSPSKDVVTANSTVQMPSGFIGKLNVHASGKVTLDWGGTDMEVRMGTGLDFLQDAVLLEPPPPIVRGEDENDGQGGHVPSEEAAQGKAYALGQVRDKLVVVPDWAKLYD